MCIICKGNYDLEMTTLDCSYCPNLTSLFSTNFPINLTSLDCSFCPKLTTIPDTLVNLTILECSECPKLTTIPDTLVNLTELGCFGCPKLTTIPDTFANLRYLGCFSCPKLTSLPVFINPIDVNCYYCPWINSHYNPEYEDNVKKFKKDYDSLLSNPLSPFLIQKVVKYLVPIQN